MPACLQVERLLDVYREQGPAQLETYVVPLLGWEELQTIKREAEAAGDSPAALPASSSAPLALPSSGGNGSGEEGASCSSVTVPPDGGDRDGSMGGHASDSCDSCDTDDDGLCSLD